MTTTAGRIGRVAIAAVLVALATRWIGWWSVPLIGAIWGFRFAPFEAALAGLTGWMGLLLWNATHAPLLPYANRLGGVFGLPGWAILMVTLLFAALLAWSAAVLVGSLRQGGR